ncbi:MAG: response regulator [Polymorphobacter sp.]
MLAGHNVLVVEDAILIVMNIEAMLADVGCRSVASAGTVAEALALLAAAEFDLAIIDVSLGPEESWPVAERLAALGVPFVFSTGHGDGVRDPRFLDRPVLRKPWDARSLAATLATLLADRALRDRA